MLMIAFILNLLAAAGLAALAAKYSFGPAAASARFARHSCAVVGDDGATPAAQARVEHRQVDRGDICKDVTDDRARCHGYFGNQQHMEVGAEQTGGGDNGCSTGFARRRVWQ